MSNYKELKKDSGRKIRFGFKAHTEESIKKLFKEYDDYVSKHYSEGEGYKRINQQQEREMLDFTGTRLCGYDEYKVSEEKLLDLGRELNYRSGQWMVFVPVKPGE